MPRISAGGRANTAKTSGSVSVLTSSTTIVTANNARLELTIRNIDATNFVDLMLNTGDGTTVPTATAGNGIRLKAGDSWTTNSYTGPIAGIANTATVAVTVLEI